MISLRIVGGCKAGHVPWYVFFLLRQRYKCGGALINKVREESFCFQIKSMQPKPPVSLWHKRSGVRNMEIQYKIDSFHIKCLPTNHSYECLRPDLSIELTSHYIPVIIRCGSCQPPTVSVGKNIFPVRDTRPRLVTPGGGQLTTPVTLEILR